jgi:hypothetical protein
MSIKVRYFAILKDSLGRSEDDLAWTGYYPCVTFGRVLMRFYLKWDINE